MPISKLRRKPTRRLNAHALSFPDKWWMYLTVSVLAFVHLHDYLSALPSNSARLASNSIDITATNTQEQQLLPAPTLLDRPKNCSTLQMDTMHSLFKTNLHEQNARKRFHTPLMFQTRCPDETWLRDFLQRPMTNSSCLAVNVGCNKGLDAIEMARTLSKNSRFSVREWNSLLNSSSRPVCGAPGDIPLSLDDFPTAGQVHCIEPMAGTVRDLKTVSQKLGYDDTVVITLRFIHT